jgi:hypothetical protein
MITKNAQAALLEGTKKAVASFTLFNSENPLPLDPDQPHGSPGFTESWTKQIPASDITIVDSVLIISCVTSEIDVEANPKLSQNTWTNLNITMSDGKVLWKTNIPGSTFTVDDLIVVQAKIKFQKLCPND